MHYPSNPEFDAAVRLLMETPLEFPKALTAAPSLLQIRGLHSETLLHYLAVEGQVDGVRVLLTLGAAPDAVNRFGNTPLQDAARLGNAEIAKALLECGADLHATAPDGSTALHYAAEHGKKDLYQMLIRAGADPTRQNQYGEKPSDLLDGPEARFAS